jgi:hypothetical protein
MTRCVLDGWRKFPSHNHTLRNISSLHLDDSTRILALMLLYCQKVWFHRLERPCLEISSTLSQSFHLHRMLVPPGPQPIRRGPHFDSPQLVLSNQALVQASDGVRLPVVAQPKSRDSTQLAILQGIVSRPPKPLTTMWLTHPFAGQFNLRGPWAPTWDVYGISSSC